MMVVRKRSSEVAQQRLLKKHQVKIGHLKTVTRSGSTTVAETMVESWLTTIFIDDGQKLVDNDCRKLASMDC